MPLDESVQFQVWLYQTPYSGAYRILPFAGDGRPGVADGTSGRVTVDAGYAEASLNMIGAQSDFPDLVPRARVEFYARYISKFTGEPRLDLLHQAEIDRVMPWIDEKHVPRLRVTLIGLWAQAGRQLCYKKYAHAVTGDKSSIFGDLAKRFVATGRLSDITVQALPVGADVIYFPAVGDNGVGMPFGQAAAALSQDVGQVATGGEVAQLTGGGTQRRIFFRPFDDLTQPARHTLLLPSTRIGQTRREQDVTGQATGLQIVGGATYYPNLLAPAVAGNTTFNDPLVPGDSSAANQVSNGSFEAATGGHGDDSADYWAGFNGSSVKQFSDENIQAFDGNWYWRLDHSAPSEHIYQFQTNLPVAPNAGDIYCLTTRARLDFESNKAGGHIICQPCTAGLVAVGPPISLEVMPQDATWNLFSLNFPWPAGAPGATFTAQCDYQATVNDPDFALLIDDIRLYNVTGLEQKGWDSEANGSTAFNTLNWYEETNPWIGGSAVYIDVTGAEDTNGRDAIIKPAGDARFPITGGQDVIGGFVLQVLSGSLKMAVQLFEWEQDGTSIAYAPTEYTATSADWTTYTTEKEADENGKEMELKLSIRGTGILRIGAAFAFDKGLLPIGYTSNNQIVDPSKPYQFTQGGQFVTTLYAKDLFAPGTLIYEAADELGDIALQESHPEITNQTDAETYGIAYFEQHVPVLERPDIESFGVIETGDPSDGTLAPSTATMMPGESVRLLGGDSALIMPNPLCLHEKTWQYDGKLTITPYVSAEPRDAARTLVDFVRNLMTSGKLGATTGGSGGGSSGGSASNGSGASITIPVPPAQGGTGQITAALGLSALGGESWAGVWASGATYNQWAEVSRSGSLYVSIIAANTGHDPSTDDGTHWQLKVAPGAGGTGWVVRGTWSSATAYAIGDVVDAANNARYVAVEPSTDAEPTTDSGANWYCLSAMPNIDSGDRG